MPNDAMPRWRRIKICERLQRQYERIVANPASTSETKEIYGSLLQQVRAILTRLYQQQELESKNDI